MTAFNHFRIIATSTFGLESVLVKELRGLGYDRLVVENGRVSFEGSAKDVARCNVFLRTADRILIEIGRFRAGDFDELFQGVRAISWEEMIPVDGKMHVTGRSVKSKLASVRDCQSVVKKAIIESMKRKYRRERFDETGPLYRIEVSLLRDSASITVDTTGDGLHKRGYRLRAGGAPLIETLAAGMALLSRWTPDRILADPFCGSGTIAIEAALMGKKIAPGAKRSFVSEQWGDIIPEKIWLEARQEAESCRENLQFRILASDIDPEILKIARNNAERAGVADVIAFQTLPVDGFRSRKKYGLIVSNPPYGERIGVSEGASQLYRTMGEVFSRLDSWSFFLLSGHPDFQRYYGQKADRNRKLYNGNLKCYLYEYLSPYPRTSTRNRLLDTEAEKR